MNDGDQITLRGLTQEGVWELEVVLDKPVCTICDNRNHPMVAFVLHSGAPVCAACVINFAPVVVPD